MVVIFSLPPGDVDGFSWVFPVSIDDWFAAVDWCCCGFEVVVVGWIGKDPYSPRKRKRGSCESAFAIPYVDQSYDSLPGNGKTTVLVQ